MTISGKTQLLGLLGWPVAHSFSPAMHNAAAAALGLDVVYVPLPVRPEDVGTAVSALPALGFLGVNVTVPHKQAVIPLLHDLEPGAAAIGAVNTIVMQQLTKNNEQLTTRHLQSPISNPQSPISPIGYNTDWTGFLADLADLGVAVNGRDCLILGAGGSARAVAYALAVVGGRVQVLARRSAQAQELVAAIGPHVPRPLIGWLNAWPLAELATAVAHTTAPLIVNTTPLGMTPHTDDSPWPADLPIPPDAFVYDLVYNPTTTKLMRQAQTCGCRAANGLGMLVWQGAKGFELWTGQTPDVAVMRAALGVKD
ncbi:MAG: shikimate dehydrogenase [Chloroflexi bacterium]|nr:shikimate dehydrogenase [Chloroflexota bacterium]MBP7041326.1 shikimate dehydrogenase [Chloroflexota bacterium]